MMSNLEIITNNYPSKVTLHDLLKSTKLTHFLLDASGVLYTDKGPIPQINETVKKLQSLGHVYITTNNSSFSIQKIQKKLKDFSINIEKDHIISSGLGLKDDKKTQSIINNKNIYLFGNKSSMAYLSRTSFKAIVPHPDLADVIVLTSSYKKNQNSLFSRLITSLKQHPRPIICCNPDEKVVGKSSFIYVIGHYAKILHSETKLPIHWFGKPYANYSNLVKKVLLAQHPFLDFKSCCFFDDNLSNVIELQNTINVNGCWIKDSGISQHLSIDNSLTTIGSPTFMLPKLSFS
jgi:HAD superfamily hydrolase (TIGR01450 family)